MSQEYTSSNPFRRKGAQSNSTSVAQEPLPVVDNRLYHQPEATAPQSIDVTKKPVKKVRVQSPHPASPLGPDTPSTPSTVVGGDDSTYNRAPTPGERDDDPFEPNVSDTSSDESEIQPSQAPPNPFKKTLETMEQSKREATTSRTNTTNTGRASLDVEAFKRLLMTGNAGPGMSTLSSPPPANIHRGLGDGGSSTDASSLSRHSTFETVHEQHLDTPGTPHEISEPEDDRRGAEIMSSTNDRKKPLPPSSRHGKLIKIELRGDPSHAPTTSISTPPIPIPTSQSSSRSSTSYSLPLSSPSSVVRSPTDLNKPLPPAPERTSRDSDRQSIFDLESAGKVPEPPSPPRSIRRRTPPPRPITRRRSQRVPDPRSTRTETEKLSTSVEQEAPNEGTLSVSNIDPTSTGVGSRSDSARIPPPPPSRRPASIRGSARQSSSNSSSSQPVAFAESLSARGSPSRERHQNVVIDAGTNKRASMIPPPPPPPRLSGESSRKSWDSARKGSETSSVQEERPEERPDILADLTKLQREIDALRARGDRSLP